jgi:hypothetical protein
VHWDGAKPQNSVIQIFCTKGGQILLYLPSTREKSFSFHFKCYNLTIHAVNFCETFCTCYPRARFYDWKCKKVKRNLSGLLELEMADLGCVLRKKATILWGLFPKYLRVLLNTRIWRNPFYSTIWKSNLDLKYKWKVKILSFKLCLYRCIHQCSYQFFIIKFEILNFKFLIRLIDFKHCINSFWVELLGWVWNVTHLMWWLFETFMLLKSMRSFLRCHF